MRRGAGKKNEPYQFWLPGKEEDMRPDERAGKEEHERWHNRWLRALFTGKRKYGLPPLMSLEELESGSRGQGPGDRGQESGVPPKAGQESEGVAPLAPVLVEEGLGMRGNEAPREIKNSPREVPSPSDLPATSETQEPTPPAPAASEPPPMLESPTEYVPIETTPLPPGILRPAPQPDPDVEAAARLRSRRWPV
jgi:hypothetical protein